MTIGTVRTPMSALSERRWLRFTAFTACYFGQGVPWGLVSIAIPAYMAEVGFSVGDIAAYIGVAGLPWGLKLIGGPFMDRFKFPSMGFRRPWVLIAQGGLTLSMASFGFADFEGSLLPLMAIGFVINAFAATQDVAVDGMAIDLLHDDERGRANALMGFGQVTGSSAYGALAGTLLSLVGAPITALVCTITMAAIFLFVAMIRERPGEKLMPWLPGAATERPEVAKRDLRTIFRDLFRVLFLPMSLMLVAVEFFNRVRDGIAESVFPAFAVQHLGFTAAEYSQFNGYIGVIAALAGALLGSFLDRYGARIFLLIALLGSAACHLAMGFMPGLWENTDVVIQLALLAKIFAQLVFVAIIALFMTLCWTRVAATQFAIYMSLANLSRTVGVGGFATVADHMTPAQHFLLMGVLLAVAAGLLLLFDQRQHATRLQQIEA